MLALLKVLLRPLPVMFAVEIDLGLTCAWHRVILKLGSADTLKVIVNIFIIISRTPPPPSTRLHLADDQFGFMSGGKGIFLKEDLIKNLFLFDTLNIFSQIFC